MQLNQERFIQLLQQYITGDLSPEEYDLLQDWIKDPAYQDTLYTFIDTFMEKNDWEGEENPAIGSSIHQYLDQRINGAGAKPIQGSTAFTGAGPVPGTGTPAATQRPVFRIPADAPVLGRKRIMAAAAVLLILTSVGVGTAFLRNRSEAKENISATHSSGQQVKPGSSGAILTLADGRQITLDSAGSGTLALQGQTQLIRQGGQLQYSGKPAEATGNPNATTLYNTISTPRGRQYNIVLADGSRVWLNAASSIRYPVSFTGKERRVEVSGEAWFEVSPQQQPFIVKINTGTTPEKPCEVLVLGTRFNVNAYEDEPVISVSLLDGAVKVNSSQSAQVLHPGQQAQVSPAGRLDVSSDVDMDAVSAWRTGSFAFRHTGLTTVMRQLARWYDVEIVYTDSIPDRRFGGRIPRNIDLQDVLKILELSKVNFKIQGRKIMVQP